MMQTLAETLYWILIKADGDILASPPRPFLGRCTTGQELFQ